MRSLSGGKSYRELRLQKIVGEQVSLKRSLSRWLRNQKHNVKKRSVFLILPILTGLLFLSCMFLAALGLASFSPLHGQEQAAKDFESPLRTTASLGTHVMITAPTGGGGCNLAWQ